MMLVQLSRTPYVRPEPGRICSVQIVYTSLQLLHSQGKKELELDKILEIAGGGMGGQSCCHSVSSSFTLH